MCFLVWFRFRGGHFRALVVGEDRLRVVEVVVDRLVTLDGFGAHDAGDDLLLRGFLVVFVDGVVLDLF